MFLLNSQAQGASGKNEQSTQTPWRGAQCSCIGLSQLWLWLLFSTGVGSGGAGSASSLPKVLIWWNAGQNLWKLAQNPWNSEQKWRPKQLEAFYYEVTFLVFFGQVWENSGKNFLHPQKFACSYTRAIIPSLFLRFVLILQYHVLENISVLISKICPYLWLASLFSAA